MSDAISRLNEALKGRYALAGEPDGTRFIMVASADGGSENAGANRLSNAYLGVNWFEELKERMGN